MEITSSAFTHSRRPSAENPKKGGVSCLATAKGVRPSLLAMVGSAPFSSSSRA
jgi:hypothetical protein